MHCHTAIATPSTTTPSLPAERVFVVKLQGPDACEQHPTAGCVQHVLSGRQLQFVNATELLVAMATLGASERRHD